MKSCPQYPSYKSYGVEWLGDVPSHWNVKRLKYVVSINDDVLSEDTDDDYEFAYVDIGSVDNEHGITSKETVVFENAPSRARRVVRRGDTIVSTVRTYLRAIAPITEKDDRTIVSTGFAVVRPRRIDARYLSYYIRSQFFVENVVSKSVGVSYPAINALEIGNISSLLPPLPEQKAIAAFLDRETERIDGLIGKREKLIALLQEKRGALISHAVTKGLNPSAKMKPSGIDWLGDIPAHWNIWKVGHGYLETGSGTTPPSDSDDWYDGAINWVTTSELREKPIFESSKKISESALKTFSALKLFPKGTLLIAMYGATIGRLGTLETEATTNQACCALVKSNVFRNQFVFYWFQSFKNIVVLLASGGGQPNISQDKIRSLEVAIPSFGEQDEITSYLDVETKKIDGLMEREQQIIERMKEYRSALISAAVTGKIDVSTGHIEPSVSSVSSVDRKSPQKTQKAQKGKP